MTEAQTSETIAASESVEAVNCTETQETGATVSTEVSPSGSGGQSKTLPFNRYVWFFGLAIVGLAIDLGSKEWVFDKLGFPGEGKWVQDFFGGWSTFRFYTSINEGALWGIGQGMTWLFAGLSVVAIVGVSIWLFKFKAAQSLWLTIALAFVMAGTLGNLYDRLGLHGIERNNAVIYGVRDFLFFTFGKFNWPIFNFADIFLVTGAIMLGIHSFQAEKATANSKASTTAKSPNISDGKSMQKSAAPS
jgi:signal peptidase II